MNKIFSLSGVMMGLASLTLSTSVWATTMDDMDDWFTYNMPEPDYMLTDMADGTVDFMDGLGKGMEVSDEGAMHRNYDCYMGDKLTDLRTDRSGIIKGVHKEGTMDVMTPSGKTVRYQYVIFSVKPVK